MNFKLFFYFAGLDLNDMADVLMTPGADIARNAFKLKPTIYKFQESFSSIEKVTLTQNGVDVVQTWKKSLSDQV